jgi:hypothetical protein
MFTNTELAAATVVVSLSAPLPAVTSKPIPNENTHPMSVERPIVAPPGTKIRFVGVLLPQIGAVASGNSRNHTGVLFELLTE